MEDERVDDLVRKGVLLLQQSLNEDVGRTTALGARRSFLSSTTAALANNHGQNLKNGVAYISVIPFKAAAE